MKIFSLKTNHLTNPLGYRMERPTFSWKMESNGSVLCWSRVEISADEDFSEILYDSGQVKGLLGLDFQPDFVPAPRTRYFWRVSAAAGNGDTGVSDPAWFETALPANGWQAKWISPDFDSKIHPVFQKSFTLPDGIISARAYACGLGIYELSVNGRKAGEEYLLPGFHAYDYWLQYQTFDVTDLLQSGENTVSAALGNGWYKGRFGFQSGACEWYGDTFQFLCQLEVTLSDGTRQVICTGEDWACRPGNCLESSIYDGEFTDGSMELAGLDVFGGEKDGGWTAVKCSGLGMEKLSPRLSPAITYQEAIPVAEVIHTPAGETVFDFGQELTGWVEFVCHAPKGTKLTLKFGELLQDENFYQGNLRTAKATFTYISAGKGEKVRPRFTFFGFRYMKLEGFENPDPTDFTAHVIQSDLERTGFIETSDPRVNRLFLNALWGQKGNFLDVPTDCPQRDERMGWTGDAQAFCGTACLNMDSAAFYTKYLHDMLLEQTADGGSVPHVVPVIKKNGENSVGKDSCAWADAAVIIPWTVYVMCGDKDLLEQQYPSMKMWTEKMMSYDEADGGKRLWLTGFHFADWLALDNYKDPKSCFGGTDPHYVASAYYAYSTGLTAKAAKVLGKEEDAIRYAQRAAEVREAILKEYFTPSGRCAIDTQTAYVVALYMELTPASMRPRLIAELHRKLEENNMKLTTGFVGTAYLCRVLSEYGVSEDAYALLLNDEMPGWLYEVKMGATTVWERWNSVLPDGHVSDISMNSLNHYAYGAIAEWMYRWMCGVNPVEEAPGFSKAVFSPRPGKGLSFAKAKLNTASGWYESGWQRQEDGSVRYDFTVPFNCEARLELASWEDVTVDGSPAKGPVCLTPGHHVAIAK